MPASPSSLIASLSAAPAGLSTQQLAAGLPTALARVPDPPARRGNGPHVMAALRDAAIGALRLARVTNIAAANHRHARNANHPLALLGIT
jgi:hypothetical protein